MALVRSGSWPYSTVLPQILLSFLSLLPLLLVFSSTEPTQLERISTDDRVIHRAQKTYLPAILREYMQSHSEPDVFHIAEGALGVCLSVAYTFSWWRTGDNYHFLGLALREHLARPVRIFISSQFKRYIFNAITGCCNRVYIRIATVGLVVQIMTE